MTTQLSSCCLQPVRTYITPLSEEDVYEYVCTACGQMCDILPPEAAVSAGTSSVLAGAHTEDVGGGRVPPAFDTPRTDAITHPAVEYTTQSGVVMACHMQAMERELLTGIEMILARDRRITHLEERLKAIRAEW